MQDRPSLPDPLPPLDETFFVPPGGPPQGPGPSKEIFGLMGEENIYGMCAEFYEELEKTSIRPLFPEDMLEASRKNAAFIIGVTGGPPRYRELYGEPIMRRRHMHLPINEAARQEWLGAFKRVLEHAPERYQFPEAHLPGFVHWLEEFSAWMVNRS